MRKRIKRGPFGYEHSQYISLEQDMQEPFSQGSNNFKSFDEKVKEQSEFPLKLMQRLAKAADKDSDKKLSFEDWKRRKATEQRIKRKLVMDAFR